MSYVSLPVLSPRLDRATMWQKLATVALGSAVLAAAAHVQVPFWPVPITLQSLAVLLIGVITGPRLAAATLLAYVIEGAIGLPVFAHGGGLVALLGPSGGYIVGFLPAAVLAGIAAQRGWMRGLVGTVAAFLAAEVVIFACGLTWLAMSVGWSRAIAAGLLPFVAGELIKIALAAAVSRVKFETKLRRS